MEVPSGCVISNCRLFHGQYGYNCFGEQWDAGIKVIDAFDDNRITGADDVNAVCCSEYMVAHGKHLTMDGRPYEGMPDIDMQVTVSKSFEMRDLQIVLMSDRTCLVIWGGVCGVRDGILPPLHDGASLRDGASLHTACGFEIDSTPVKVMLAQTNNGMRRTIGVMTKNKIMWRTMGLDSTDALCECVNPCGSTDVDIRWRGGWWSMKRRLAPLGKASPEDCPFGHYIATDLPFKIAPYERFDPPLISETTDLPVELCVIIGEYAGIATAVWNCSRKGINRCGVRIFPSHNRMRISRYDRLQQDGLPYELTGMHGYSVFENHVVVYDGVGVTILDTNNMDREHIKLPWPDPTDFEAMCLPNSFKIGNRAYSYDAFAQLTAVGPAGPETFRDIERTIDIAHDHLVIGYIDDDYPLKCGMCNSTCITVKCLGIHVKVPPFGKCQLHVIQRGSRVAIVLSGKQGWHFQLYDLTGHMAIPDDDPDASSLLMYCGKYDEPCENASITFFGDGVCIGASDHWYIPTLTDFFLSPASLDRNDTQWARKSYYQSCLASLRAELRSAPPEDPHYNTTRRSRARQKRQSPCSPDTPRR